MPSRVAEWGNSLSLFFYSETWLILTEGDAFSVRPRSCRGFAASPFKHEVYLVFLWNVNLAFFTECFFHTVGGKKSFFFTSVSPDIVYSKSGFRDNSCHIYIQMTFKISCFIIWAPISMQFQQVNSPDRAFRAPCYFMQRMKSFIPQFRFLKRSIYFRRI